MRYVDDMVGIAKDQTRATIAYGVVFAFVLAATRNAMWASTGSVEAVGMLKDLALIAVSFYFGSKANGAKP